MGVSIPQEIIFIFNLAFLIIKTSSIEEFNYQYELRDRRRVNELRRWREIKLENDLGL